MEHLCHFQQLHVRALDAGAHSTVQHGQDHQKADEDGERSPADPHQRQNDEAGHRRGLDQLDDRGQQRVHPGPALGGSRQQNADHHAQRKPQQDMPGAEPHPLPEIGLR